MPKTLTKPKDIWSLPDALYKEYIEEEVQSYSNDDGWIEDELAMCFGFDDLANPDRGLLYWARRHWYLTNKQGIVVLFRPTPLQWMYLLQGKNENVELKARKMGQSTVIDLKYYWRARRREHQNMMIVAHALDAAAELWGRIQFAHRQIQEYRPFLHAPIKRSNRRELEWTDNYSKLRMTTAGGKGIGRAADVDGAHLSEAAHYDSLREVMASLGEARRPGSYLDIESTPHGFDDFRDEYVKARDGATKRQALFHEWFQDPGNRIENGGDEIDDLTDEEGRLMRLHRLDLDQIAWRREKQEDLGPLFAQEHPEDDETCFLLGGTPLFDNLTLREIYRRIEQEERELTEADIPDAPFGTDAGRLSCWVPPKPGHAYIIGADIAEGIPGLAYTVAHVLDITDGADQVAQWRGHLNPFTFGIQILGPLGLWYNRALLVPERNNHGHACIAGLKELPYPRIYKHRSNMSSRWGKAQKPKYGFPTSHETRPQLLALLRRMLSTGDYHPRSLRLIKECMSMQAEEAHHDADKPTNEFRDCIFAAGISLFVRKKSLPIIISE